MHLIEGKLCARTDQCKARWDLFRVWLCKRTACTISMSRIVEGQQIDKQEGKQASNKFDVGRWRRRDAPRDCAAPGDL